MSLITLTVKGVYPGKSEKAPTSLMVVGEKDDKFYLKVWRFNAERGLDVGTVINIDKEKIRAEDYKGKAQYSCNDSDIAFDRDEHHQPTVAKTAQPQATQAPTQSVWDKKDRQIVRCACLHDAATLHAGLLAEDGSNADSIAISMIFMAAKYEAWVFRNGRKEEPESDFADEPDQADMEQGLPLDKPTVENDEQIPF